MRGIARSKAVERSYRGAGEDSTRLGFVEIMIKAGAVVRGLAGVRVRVRVKVRARIRARVRARVRGLAGIMVELGVFDANVAF